ncbi:MAG: PAS domain S-box protein [Pikeienuella sp.]
MTEDERLREALIELERMRARENAALREKTALVDALERMTVAATLPGGTERPVDVLLASVAEGMPAAAVLLVRGAEGGLLVERAWPTALAGLRWDAGAGLLSKRRRLKDLAAPAAGVWRVDQPAALAGYRALAGVPVRAEVGEAAALVCLDPEPDRFAAEDLALLERFARLAAQGLSAEALAARTQLLTAVIEGSAASIAIADATVPDMPLIYVNPAFERLTGYPAAEVIGANCRLLSDEAPDSPERMRLRETVSERRHGRFELRNRRRDGSLFWNQLSLYPVRAGDGATEYLVATQVDVTDRRAVESERDAARDRLVEALSSTAQGFLLADAEGRVVFANESYRDCFPPAPEGPDWAAGNDVGAVWAARLRAGDAGASAEAAAEQWRARLFAGGAEREERLPDGRVLLISERRTRDRGALAIVTDVTSLKAAEELLAQRAAAIDAAQDGIALTDPQGRFVYMNTSHRTMFGFDCVSEILGRPWTVLYSPDTAARLEQIAMPALAETGAWRGEPVGRRKDGSAVDQEVSLTRLSNGGLVCVTRDVSERRQAERERMRLRDQLQVAQRQEAIGQLAAGIAHDFNNLLSAISGSAALLQHGLNPDAPQRAHAERIIAASGRAAELISRLLDIGARKTERSEIDLGGLIADAVDLVKASTPSRIQISLDLPRTAVRVVLDPSDILQLVLNLAINARDAIGERPGEITIALREAEPALTGARPKVGRVAPGLRYLAITVADTGGGIPPETAERIFTPYFTTKGAAGTGLGLSVVASIVSSNQGALLLDTRPGEGCTFTILWPQDGAVAERRAPRLGGDAAEAEARAALTGKTVLVAEDAAPVLRVIAEIFEAAGAEVGTCEDPRDALAAITEDPEAWSLLVTDFDMPEMTGAELALAARRAAPGLAIMLCSALPDRRRRSLGEDEAGSPLFDTVIGKPVREGVLLAAAVQAIDLRRESVRRAVAEAERIGR